MQMTALKGYPLSMQQARLWGLQGESKAYFVQCSVQLQGPLDMTTLLYALQHLVKRHDILRTRFSHLPGMEIPVQVVASYVKVHCPVIDLENLSASDQTAFLDEYFTALKQKDVELEAHFLLFVALVRLSSKMHLLFLHLPALCADGETLTQMVTELGQIYASLLGGTQHDDEPLQYADVAAWQQELVVSEEEKALREYWRKIDLSSLANIQLPFEQKLSSKSSKDDIERNGAFTPYILELPLEESISAQISHLAQCSGISIEVWLLACWEAVFWHLNGKQDLVIGVARNGRDYEELTNALGLYTRFVPIRTHLQEDQLFDQIVTSVNRTFLEATEGQIYFTWEEASTGNPTASSFFPLCFEYECWPASFVAEQLTILLTQKLSCTEPFSLKLSVCQKENLLELALHYDPHRISITQVQQLATVFCTLFEQVVAQPRISVSRLSLLKPDEQVSLLAMGCAPTRQIPFQGLHHLFAEQARRQPSQLAVISAREHLTYQQLNEQANRLAQVLRQQGVGPNVLVGLLMGRQVQMLVGLLGILKAGGAYLPLDPVTPQERLSYLLQESGAELLLVQHEFRPHLPTWRGKTLCLEDLELELSQVSTDDLSGGSDTLIGEDLAYVIYTSGSTGVPKGVMVRQSSVVNYTLALCEQLGAEPGWQYATGSTLGADLGNTAIFCALASGGCVQILDYETVTSAQTMAKWVEQHPIDVLKIVPSHLSALLESEQAQALLPRRALICGGEVFPISLLERVQNLGGSCQVYNHYGPTETTIGVLVHPLGQAQVLKEERVKSIPVSVPLGQPIPNTEVYVLDSRMQLVPVGVTGELYIGGAGLALGYRYQPEQTAQRFVPHPWNLQGGARLYRTGDRARYDEEGRIEFVGRTDNQIKLRGYRIELAEIEAVLRRQPQIRDCAVLLQEDGPAGPRLIGYVVAHTASGLTSEALGKILRNTLPEYMVPSLFVMIDALPLTANGKVDRWQLPRPEQVQSSEPVTPAKPRSPIEEVLLSIWKDLLVVPLLGIYDNFFAVGGHSLLATRLMAQIRAVLQVELPVQVVFDTPTVAGLAQLVEQALRKGEGTQIPPLVARARPEVLPLSFAQQRLWFLDQLEPGSTAYLAPRTQRLVGNLNLKALEQSLQELVRRHESLRTTFEERANQPVQVIHPAGPSTLPVIDLRGLDAKHREGEARRLASQERLRPCNLATGPLLRIYLLQLAPQEHVLLQTLHHIITDGWSNEVLVRELTILYQAKLSGQPSSLAPLPLQYADYALWQREWLQGEALEAQVAYWRSKLAGVPPLELPTDHPRSPVRTQWGTSQVLPLSPVLSEQLAALSRQQNMTPFMLLLAALQVLLARYTGQRDISVGTPIANRRHAEIEGVIGFFVNTLVLRTDLSGNPTFLEVLQRVRQVCLGAYAHQDLPFEKVVEELVLERDLSRSPLFQVMFVFHHALQELGEPAEISVSPLALGDITSKFDLVLVIAETRQGLHCTLRYSTDLFEADTIKRLVGHWQTLLEGIVQDPQARLLDLPLLTEAERRRLLIEWNATQCNYQEDLCLHQLFEQQVQRTPDAVTLVFEDEFLTYAQLNQRANQLAHYFQDLGVGPEVLVGICMERSLEMIIGLLGVLKAGGAYVPLDPGYPAERLAFMVQDAGVSVLLTQQQLQRQLPPSEAHVIVLEQVWERWLCESDQNLVSIVSPQNLAYVIYTSGSTGKPKGAMNTHQGLRNRLCWMQDTYQLTSADRVLQKTPLSFDVSVWECFWPLFTGASLIVAAPGGHQDPTYLKRLIVEQAITTLHFVPSMLQAFLLEPNLQSCRSLRLVMCSGEPLSVELQARFFSHFAQGVRLQNLYGPTEASIDVTFWECQCDNDDSRVPIGRPIANTQIYLLDKHLQPVPIGVAGELHIGGRGLGRGYLDRPELTAEKFLADPFSQQAGARLYRTGDLARYRGDGVIEFLGRLDDQVKLRGYRIELGEIEAMLRAYPAVQEGVVLVREDEAGEKRLVVYMVRQEGQTLEISDVRSYLQDHLPTYMIPSAFVLLDALPLTPNGKVDRRALPGPEQGQQSALETFVAPRTVLEKHLASMWQEMLHVEQVGVHDSFFDLGGESIKAAVFMNKLQEFLGVILHVVTLFDVPTVAGLADYLAKRHRDVLEQVFGAGAHLSPEIMPHTSHRIDVVKLAHIRSLIPPLPPLSSEQKRPVKNPSAVFVLSPPRSGSTLLRVMLAGHPCLFAPPELELLSFNTLRERSQAFTGRNSFWLEGMVRALMEIHGWDAQRAKAFLSQCEQQDLTTQQLYAVMQQQLGQRTLVDKTPGYALDLAILQRAEETFEQPRYIHLIRHPYGMIHSFEEASLDQVFFRYAHPFETRELAELIWLVSHQNIREFFRTVPAERQIQVHFEELVQNPEGVMRELAAFLHLDFHPDLLQPYTGQRMTDGISASSKMLGDVKFHQHQTIDTDVIHRWQKAYTEDFLGEIAWQMAQTLGYQGEISEQASEAEKGSQSSLENKFLAIKQVPRKGQQAFPLSFAQQRLWFLDQLEPGSTTYLMPSALRLGGTLDAYSLECALEALISRHESLHTTFEVQAGQPMQVIHPVAPYTLPVIDLQGLAEEEREQQARRLASQERQHPCDLATGPLLRTYLLRLGSQEHVLLLTLHHIITDGWSNGVLMRELNTLYQALTAGEPSPLAPLPIQYADYALWQRQWLQGEVLEEQLAYWRNHLRDLSPLVLPTDHPRPAIQTHRGARQALQVTEALSQGLINLSRQQDVTLFMLLLAAFQVLLARYAGQRDISVGTPIANRNHAEIEGVIGFFVNTLVLRTDLAGNPTFLEVLQRVREVCLGAYAHQDVPFEKVVEELVLERDLSHSPLFQVMLILQNTSPAKSDLRELSIGSLEVERSISKFDLTLSIAQTGQGLSCALEYNRDLFKPETIGRLLSHWQTLLEGIIANPQAHLSDLPLLTAAEQECLLVTWNATETEFAQDGCVHELFEQQVQRTPEATAVVFEDEQVTYQTLNQRANQLAHYFRQLGVGSEVLVGICMDRSIEMVIAMLGVLKAGGAYVPLDPGYPAQRLAFLLEDAEVFLLLVHHYHLKKVLEHHRCVICLETAWPILAQQPRHNLPNSTLGDHLAYVMYTSGSTGTPKGVMISHRAIRNRLLWGQRATHLTTSDRTLQVASLSFDISLWEIFGPLLAGACLVQAHPEGVQDSRYLLMLLQEQQITVAHFVPTLFDILLQAEELRKCRSLRCLLYGGEASSADLPGRFFAQSQGQLQQFYGPTEASINATSWVGDPAHLACIGRPIANMQVYVLDADGQPVPIGSVGEIYLGGAGLARGYFKRADLSAERFVPHPWSQEPGARLYRTGDLGRYRSDGNLEFVGRKDQQVKIRGYRIELGEIEAVLRAHPAVQEGVVLAREDVPGEKRLVAYMVGSQKFTIAGLRSFLQEKLPASMIPSQFLHLDAIPLMPNGKVDRKSLPVPEEWYGQAEEGQQRARTGIEEVLVELWSQVLGRAQVGIHDTFFELGGHSLLVTQLLARVRAVLGVELPVRAVFEAPTVAELAQRVELALRKGEGTPMPPLVARARPEVLPLSFAQQRLWFLDQLEPESLVYLMSRALHLDGQIDAHSLEHALQALISRHESLRTTFEVQDGQPVQVIHPAGPYSLPVIDLQGLGKEQREQQARRLASQERQRPCDLATGPLLRMSLLRLGSQEHVLLQTLHHIITDGWSDKVLVRELTTLYQAFLSGQPSPLAPLPLQHADYALWQREWLQGEVLQHHLEYWKKQLWEVKPLALPTDTPRAARQSHRAARYPFHLPVQLSEGLVTLSRQEGVTLFMLLLAAFQVLLYRWTDQTDIVVGTDVANRNQIETEGLIGFFVNQLALRSRLSGDQTFRELLHQVRSTTIDAYLHQEIPFQKLVEVLEPERSAQSIPFFSVKMLLQTISPQEIHELPSITVDPFLFVGEMDVELDLLLRFSQTSDGLKGTFDYRLDLFEEATIGRLTRDLLTLLEDISRYPDKDLDMLELLNKDEKEQPNMQRKKRETTALSLKLKNIQPQAVQLHQNQLIRKEFFDDQNPLPLIIRPQVPELVISQWAEKNVSFLETELGKHGALLFRGFHIPTPDEFERFASILCPDLFQENGEHIPVKDIGHGSLYTPVFYAPEKKLLWHHENSFNAQWPMRILFHCARPADQGGETPIVDSRKIFQLLDPAIRNPFIEKGILYVRTYKERLGLSWQTVFRTTDKQEVEARCRREEIEFEWKDGNGLITRQVRPAVIKHPQTGEMVWWNQAPHWHPACLDQDTRASLLTLFAPDELPRNCFYGDGSPIEEDVMDAICAAYQKAEVCFPWKTGDILLLDNLMIAHARNPYRGQRKIYVSMGNMMTLQDL